MAIAAAIGAAVDAGAIAALPLLADTEAVKRAVERQLSAVAGGEVRYESYSLRYFPPLTARLSGAAIRVPGVVQGRIAALEVRLALLPLLLGNVRPAAIGATLLKLMTETFKAPIQLLDPLADQPPPGKP